MSPDAGYADWEFDPKSFEEVGNDYMDLDTAAVHVEQQRRKRRLSQPNQPAKKLRTSSNDD
jgi:hypothetical protein